MRVLLLAVSAIFTLAQGSYPQALYHKSATGYSHVLRKYPEFVQHERIRYPYVLEVGTHPLHHVEYSESQDNNVNTNYQHQVDENPSEDLQLIHAESQIDDTVAKVCEKEAKKMLMVWNIIAKYMGISGNDYKIRDTASVKRLYTIIRTFIALSKKEDFNHMSIRRIMETIQEHLKNGDNTNLEVLVNDNHESEIFKVPVDQSGATVIEHNSPEREVTSINSVREQESSNVKEIEIHSGNNNVDKYIVLPEIDVKPDTENNDVTISFSKGTNSHSSSEESSKHTEVIPPRHNEYKDDHSVLIAPEVVPINDFTVTDGPEEEEVSILPSLIILPSEHPSETPYVPLAPEKVPDVTDELHIDINEYEHPADTLVIANDDMYPRPIDIELKPHYSELHSSAQSPVSMSVWQHILMYYGSCQHNEALLMKIKVLIDALDRQRCPFVHEINSSI